MTLFQQYLAGGEIDKLVPSLINKLFLTDFVSEYKELLRGKISGQYPVLHEPRTLNILFNIQTQDGEDEDFDMVFLSYLALLKFDFPQVKIKLHYRDGDGSPKDDSYFYKLNQHRVHLAINAKQEIFQLYRGKSLYDTIQTLKSGTYIPPLIIDRQSLKVLFSRKTPEKSYLKTIFEVGNALVRQGTDQSDRKIYLSKFNAQYLLSRGNIVTWNFADLSGLYLVDTIYDLFLLRHVVNLHTNKKSDYQIGASIKKGQGDQTPDYYREMVLKVLLDSQVFNFSDVETYFFSLLVQHSGLFKIPASLPEMYQVIKPFLTKEEEKKQLKEGTFTKHRYIELFSENLLRIIGYTRDIAYALEELAKNIVEHTSSGKGIITARIFSLARISALKAPEPLWLQNFHNAHQFLDINVIDSGRSSIQESYKISLEKEKANHEKSIANAVLQQLISENYQDDINKLASFKLNDFFNFNSVKLYHQINRIKARLGLLIFSQYVLRERGALIQISSNSLESEAVTGYDLFVKNGTLHQYERADVYSLGTNYNFVVPVKESFEHQAHDPSNSGSETSISSSVFMELHQFGFTDDHQQKIRQIDYSPLLESDDKYEKLDMLRDFAGPLKTDEIVLIYANDLQRFLHNSSDWVRFLATMQFGYNYVKDLIICGLDMKLYEDIVNILKIFDMPSSDSIGFWRNDRHVLFFVPVLYNGQRFWFNSLLTSAEYSKYLKINLDINLYHLNLIRISEDEKISQTAGLPAYTIDSQLMSTSRKLLNFELLLQSGSGMSLFEESTMSLMNMEINDKLEELQDDEYPSDQLNLLLNGN